MRGGDWCILRTGGGSTLPLARSLERGGFHAWTPVEFQTRRVGRNRERVEREVCVMPTYVFAKAYHLPDLVALSMAQFSPHPDFSVFRYFDRFPLIADDSLSHLRAIERRTAPKPAAPVFSQGERVRLTEGGFAGMSGVVETSKGEYTLVCFPNFQIPIKIASFLLLPDMAMNRQPDIGTAAKAA